MPWPMKSSVLRQQGAAALLVVAEGRQVHAAQRLVVAGAAAEGHAPEPVAGVHVQGRELRVGRLEEGESPRTPAGC